MQTIRQTCDTAWLAKEIRVDELTVDKNKFELTQAVEDNCKCRSRHRFMIATTAIRYELTARSSTNLHVALRISWSPTVHIIHDLRHRRCRHLQGLKNLLEATTHASASQSRPSRDGEISSSIASITNAKLPCHRRHRFTATTAVEDNCKCRSRHRFMIATTAIKI